MAQTTKGTNMQLEAKDVNDAVKQIEFFKRYKPYKYSGKWFIAYICGDWFALRTRKGLHNRAIKAGLTSLEVFTYGK